MTAIRLRCLVPGCSHTIGERKSDREPITANMQWICREHWMALPKKMRLAYSRAWNWDHGLPYRRKGARAGRKVTTAGWRIWERCKREAIERAMGIR